MPIENNNQAMRAMTIAFKLANKSINKTRPRRLQCLATAKRLIKAADDFTQKQVSAVEYKDTLTDARRYNQTKNTESKTVACSDCGDTIPMNGETCIAFGVYACQICRKGEKMIKNDKPQNAEPATVEEREAILEKLAAHLPPTRVINMDGEKRRGTLVKKTTKKPLP